MTGLPTTRVNVMRTLAICGGRLVGRPEIPALNTDLQSTDPAASVMLQLAEAALHDLSPPDRTELGVVLGTVVGSLQADWEFDRSRREAGGRYASPAAFSRTLPSTSAAEITVKLGIRGPLLTVCAGNASAGTAIRRASVWMRHMHLRHCLVGAIDAGMRDFAESPAAAVLLLGGQESVGIVTLEAMGTVDLNESVDDSLNQLVAWIQAGGEAKLHGGVRLAG
jgi:3-oxoacyl-(acyl-carrier-protein) synthase